MSKVSLQKVSACVCQACSLELQSNSVTLAYSLFCTECEGVADEYTPFQSQGWICSQIKTGSIVGAFNATQLRGNGHPTWA